MSINNQKLAIFYQNKNGKNCHFFQIAIFLKKRQFFGGKLACFWQFFLHLNSNFPEGQLETRARDRDGWRNLIGGIRALEGWQALKSSQISKTAAFFLLAN